eukprot:6183547-Pleurochrysis_carterae.AAC.1
MKEAGVTNQGKVVLVPSDLDINYNPYKRPLCSNYSKTIGQHLYDSLLDMLGTGHHLLAEARPMLAARLIASVACPPHEIRIAAQFAPASLRSATSVFPYTLPSSRHEVDSACSACSLIVNRAPRTDPAARVDAHGAAWLAVRHACQACARLGCIRAEPDEARRGAAPRRMQPARIVSTDFEIWSSTSYSSCNVRLNNKLHVIVL